MPVIRGTIVVGQDGPGREQNTSTERKDKVELGGKTTECRSCLHWEERDGLNYCHQLGVCYYFMTGDCPLYEDASAGGSIEGAEQEAFSSEIKIELGSVTWTHLRKGIWALYQSQTIDRQEARTLLEALDPGSPDIETTLDAWLEEYACTKMRELALDMARHTATYWREILDALRELYMSESIDMDTVLAGLDPTHTNSPIVLDITGAWEAERECRTEWSQSVEHVTDEEIADICADGEEWCADEPVPSPSYTVTGDPRLPF